MANATPSKTCTGCKVEKPLGEFSKNSQAKDGLRHRCRACCSQAAKRWAAQGGAAKRAATAKKWREENPERARETARKWKAANPDADRRYKKKYREAHPEAAREYRAKNAQERTEYQRKWRAENPELARAAARRHSRNAYTKDPTKAVELANRRRALILERKVGPVDLHLLWKTQGDDCALCGDLIDRDLRWPAPMCASLDHIVPLALGGTHEQSNLQWTHLVCNIRKGAKAP